MEGECNKNRSKNEKIVKFNGKVQIKELVSLCIKGKLTESGMI